MTKVSKKILITVIVVIIISLGFYFIGNLFKKADANNRIKEIIKSNDSKTRYAETEKVINEKVEEMKSNGANLSYIETGDGINRFRVEIKDNGDVEYMLEPMDESMIDSGMVIIPEDDQNIETDELNDNNELDESDELDEPEEVEELKEVDE